MSTLVMMKGLPFSGKTTFSRGWAKAKHNRIRVSWHDILNMMGSEFRMERQTIALDAALRIMCNGLRQGKDVIVDECNLFGSEWGLFTARAQQLGCRVTWHTMKTSAEVCKQRNHEAGMPILDEQIDRLAEKYADWLKQ